MTIGSRNYDRPGVCRERRTWNGADGKTKENAYTSVYSYESLTPWEFFSGGLWRPCNADTFGISLPDETVAEWDALVNRSLNRVMGKYKQHDFNAGVFLGELPETVSAVAGAGLSIFRSYKAVKKGRFHEAISILREANLAKGRTFKVRKGSSDSWLALQFGWLPLIGDAYAAADAFEKGSKRPRAIKIRASANLEQSGRYGYIAKGVRKHSVATILKTTYVPSQWEQLGLTNPALVAWELVPFSFLCDYFIGIGNWLELHAVLPKTQSTYITSYRYLFQGSGINMQGSGYAIRGSNYYGRLAKMSRRVSGVAPVPPPRIKNPLRNFGQMVNMLALASSLKG